MAKKVEEPAEETVERVDPETGEITYEAATPDADTVQPAVDDNDPDFADVEPVNMDGVGEDFGVHAYDAGEFHPELHKLEGQMRDFILDRIKNNWKPWQQMTVDEQQMLVNAIEMQARDTIRGTVRAINDYEWAHCSVVLGQVTLKGAEKGIEAKVTCEMDDDNLKFLGQHVEKRVMIIATDAETFFGADRIKYDGRGSQMDLPLGGNIKDAETGGFADETEALRAPVLDGPEPDPLAPDDDDDDEDKTDTEAPWPDDQQLGEQPADPEEPGEA